MATTASARIRWPVSSRGGLVAMSGHAVVPDVARQEGALDEITRAVKGFGVGHVTVQVERTSDCVGCEEGVEG